MRISEYFQIHIKLMASGKIEGEIEPPQDYPMAHLNATHSYSAHRELHALLSGLPIQFKCKRAIPLTCTQPQAIALQQPTHRNDFLKVGSVLAILDLGFGSGNTTRRVANAILDEATKLRQKKLKRRKSLYQRMGWYYF